MQKYRIKSAKWTGAIDGPVFKVDMHINLGQLQDKLNRAQYELDGKVFEDMSLYMPMITGSFIKTTEERSLAVQGTGIVYAGAPPSGRYLYHGKVMVDELTGSPWARFKAKKVLVSEYEGKTNAKEDIEFTKTFRPDAQARWFEIAKKNRLKAWIRTVQKELDK